MVKPTGVGQHNGIEDAELGEVQVELDQLGGKVDGSVDQLLPPAHGLDLLHRDGDLVSKPDHILHPHRPAHKAAPHSWPPLNINPYTTDSLPDTGSVNECVMTMCPWCNQAFRKWSRQTCGYTHARTQAHTQWHMTQWRMTTTLCKSSFCLSICLEFAACQLVKSHTHTHASHTHAHTEDTLMRWDFKPTHLYAKRNTLSSIKADLSKAIWSTTSRSGNPEIITTSLQYNQNMILRWSTKTQTINAVLLSFTPNHCIVMSHFCIIYELMSHFLQLSTEKCICWIK